MTLLEQLKISNFRGFDNLEIDGLSKINLFVGKNNSGKTSILEAIFLLIGMNNGQLLNTITQQRELRNSKQEEFKTLTGKEILYLFHNLDSNNTPRFYTKLSNGTERWLNFKPSFYTNTSIYGNASDYIYKPELNDVGYECFIKIKADTKKYFFPVSSNGYINLRPEYSNNLLATFISSNKYNTYTFNKLSEITKRKGESNILETLQQFDNNITALRILNDGIYFDIKGIKQLVPISIMGDGLRAFLDIITAAFSDKQNSVVCIDEIENGLHYSAYKLLWKSLLVYTHQNDVQLFISTHNIETLACLKSVLEEKDFENMQDLAKVFTVAKTSKAGYQTYRYSFEGFKNAIEHETEIRS
ncbi:ATP/GTP phosphatase [Bacteroidia bacterium]|nr:ATP/GTP phosphatase [Bacteroidia bacterium]